MVQTNARFVVLEPSKVGVQHITLLEGYLRALLALDIAADGLELVYRADPSSYAALAEDVRRRVPLDAIAVRDPNARQWIRKIAQELRATFGALRSIADGDVLLITCLSSPSLLCFELCNSLIGRKHVVVVLHSEMEALFDDGMRSWRSWGFWAWQWSRVRERGSRLGVAVVAEFIREALTSAMPEKFKEREIAVLPIPVQPNRTPPDRTGRHRIAFIGYRSRFKGFEVFQRLASSPESFQLEFAVIGGGSIEILPSEKRKALESANAYHAEIACSSIAVFPYTEGYVASLSAAALDALAAGVHIVATRRPCFQWIGRELGDTFVTLVDSETDFAALVADDAFLTRVRNGANRRLQLLGDSEFGADATQRAFAEILARAGHPRDRRPNRSEAE